jgi:putative transposase
MVRIARLVMPGWPHHLTQRGNHRQPIFFNDRDREMYLDLIAKYKDLYRITIVGYALMTNHTHNIAIPELKTSLAKGIGRPHNDFSRWMNIQLNQTGHLWQARFYSCPIELTSLPDVLAYVELNPVRARIVERPEDWKWSSARAHLTGVDETGLLDMQWWQSHFTPATWHDFLRLKLNDKDLPDRIRTMTQTGRPFASEEGVMQIERYLGRSLCHRKRRLPYAIP